MPCFAMFAAVWLLLVPSAAIRHPAEDTVGSPLEHEPSTEPAEPGCYVWMPSGCGTNNASNSVYGAKLEQHDLSSQWNRDTFGILHSRAGVDQTACLEKRRVQFNSWCQRTDARMKFVSGLEPVKPMMAGCYAWLPSGCHKHHFHAKSLWRKIEETNQSACEQEAPQKYNVWCGIADARTLFVSHPPAKPAEPGCYVWMPTGCSLHPFASKRTWKKDAVGDDSSRVSSGKTECEGERKSHWNSFCGETNAIMTFVPSKGEGSTSRESVYGRA